MERHWDDIELLNIVSVIGMTLSPAKLWRSGLAIQKD